MSVDQPEPVEPEGPPAAGDSGAADPGTELSEGEAYPAHWEADVVASDGGTVHMRPITPEDAGRLVAMHSRLSDRTIYFRFFATYRKLSDRDVEHFTNVDYRDRVALVALLGDDMIGMAMYERINSDEAEVAFVIEDAHQGRGLGSIMLEHLAAGARERGVKRFVAEVLAENRTMLRVFLDAGYAPAREYGGGVVHLVFPIEPTETSVEVMRAREHRAEARSVQRLLRPSSVVVVGASRVKGSVGHTVLVNILSGGFVGPVFVVNPSADAVAGVRSYSTVRDLPQQVDLAVVATPPGAVLAVVRDCAINGVRGLVVLSDVPGEDTHDLVELARANGMRVVGPAALGVANTDPRIRLNATLAPVLPGHGNVGFFAQSDALGIALLASAAARGIGLSSFASVGKKADVSGNDLLQYFEDDPDTGVALLYLERFANPRKFVRLCRRVGRRVPVVLLHRGRSAVSDAVFGQAGIVRVSSVKEMFDAAAVLSRQPLPVGRRVGVVGNSPALASLAREACYSAGLAVTESVELALLSSGEQNAQAIRTVAGLDSVDAVVAVFIPPLEASTDSVARALAACGGGGKPVVSCFLAFEGLRQDLGDIPSYASPEEAVAALALAADYAGWRARPVGEVPELDVNTEAARALVEAALEAGVELLDRTPTLELLHCYGITVWEEVPVASAEEAVAAAEDLGWPVALKATADHLRHRIDLGGVRLELTQPGDLRVSFHVMVARLGDDADLVVQAMAPPGVATVIASKEDAAFGPVVSFGLGGVATDLLGDQAWRAVPLTDSDASELVREPRAAPLLFGYRGAAPVDVAGVEDVLLRVARLADDLPEVAELELNPVVVSEKGLAVLGADVRVAPPARTDIGPRRMSAGGPPL